MEIDMIPFFEKRIKTFLVLFSLFFIFFTYIHSTLVNAQLKSGQDKEVKIEKIFSENDSLKVSLSFANFFTGDLLNNIHKGIPVTLFVQARLWQKKKGWFDKPLDSKIMIYKLGFDTWDEIYYLILPLESADTKSSKRSFSDMEELNSFLNERNICCLYSLDKLKGRTSYYVTLKVNIKILTLKSLKEIESWLKGELKIAKDATLSEEKNHDSFSDHIFDFALNLSGFKNQVLWSESEVFTLEELKSKQNSQQIK